MDDQTDLALRQLVCTAIPNLPRDVLVQLVRSTPGLKTYEKLAPMIANARAARQR